MKATWVLMAAPVNVFLERLRASGLLSAGQLDELAREARAGADERGLARSILKREWLTRYQTREVFHGRGESLTLGPYRLLDVLGEGGMGKVFKAFHLPLERVVALKVMRPERVAQPEAVRRFRQEIRTAGRLVHPHIVVAYDAGQEGGVHFFAMEYVEGIDLLHLVAKQGPLPCARACAFARQAALGLQHAHERGVVHRDLKPSNLIVTTSPQGEPVVKILDLGLAKLHLGGRAEAGVTQEGKVLGTPDYIAPEQALNPSGADARSDLYSLGCTLYYLLTARVPFPGQTVTQTLLQHQVNEAPPLTELCPDLPGGVEAVVRRLMAKRPEDRYADATEAAEALAPWCGAATDTDWSRVVADHRARLTEPFPAAETSRSPRRRPWWIAAGLGLAVLAVATVTVLLLLGPTRPEIAQPTPPVPLPRHQPEASEPRPDPVPPPVPPPPALTPEPRPWNGYTGPLALANAGTRILSGTPEGEPRLWDWATGQVLVRFPRQQFRLTALALSADGKHAVTGGMDNTVRLWDAATGTPIRRLEGHTTPVLGVAVSPDGGHVLTGGGGLFEEKGKTVPRDLALRLWDVATGQEIRRFPGHTQGVTGVDFAPRGLLAASASLDQTVRIWDTATGHEVRKLQGHRQGVTAVAFVEDGRTLLTASRDKTLGLWDAETGAEIRRYQGHWEAVTCLAVSADGRRAVSGGMDQTVRLWDLTTGKELARHERHKRPVNGVALTPDARTALSADLDQTVIVWPLP